jgi:chitodextrinase
VRGERCRVLVKSVASNTYTDMGLSANTAYYYKVSAVNASGVEGSASAYVSATTQPGAGGGTDYGVGKVGPVRNGIYRAMGGEWL